MANIRFLMLLLVCSGFFSSAVFAQDDGETIKVDSSLVVINAAVTDKTGRAAPSLNEKQFKVFEDGKEQPISFFNAEQTPFAAVILIDTSGSMEQRISLARAAAINFLEGLRVEDVAAIYNFDSKVSLVQDFSDSRDVGEKTYNLKARGTTVLNDAIFKAAEALSSRPEKRRAILVLSDGADTASGKSSDKALKAALAANAVIYTVDMAALDAQGLDKMQSVSALKNFAEKSGGTFVSVSGGTMMRDAFKTIVEELGSQYTLGYEPSLTSQDGKWHTLEVRISKPNLTIRTRKGYNSIKQKK